MEFCRRWGIAGDVRRLSIPEDFPRTIIFATSANGYELARFEYPSREDAAPVHSPEFLQRCSQLYFDPLLREFAASHSTVSMKYLTAFHRFEQDSDGVTAYIEDLANDAQETVRAQYLVGCDGAESLVREQLGIPLIGDFVLSHSANIYFTTPEPSVLMPYGKTIMQWLVDERGHWGGLISVDGREQWRLGIDNAGTENALSEDEAKAAIRKAAGREFQFDVRSILRWTRRRVVTERYREARVFLAGNSAHQLSPTGGFGMNTGIGDAMDLSWKLAAVANGWAGPALLEAYQRERRPIADRATSEGARNYFKLVSIPSGPEINQHTAEGVRLRRRAGRYIYNNDFHREYESDGLTFGYHYEGSPALRSEDGPIPAADTSRYRQTARPGHRAPHVWIGPNKSTIDLYGEGFTLLCTGGSAKDADPLLAAAAAKRVPLRLVECTLSDVQAAYERRMTLVRPDGHVAWRGDAVPDNSSDLIECVRGCYTTVGPNARPKQPLTAKGAQC